MRAGLEAATISRVDVSVALRQATLLGAVVVAYLVLCRRFRVLAHPLSIAVAVTSVGIVVSVFNVVIHGAWTEAPQMARRSARGSAMWGLLIGGVCWLGRAMFLWLRRSP
jgi:hypothetical protein